MNTTPPSPIPPGSSSASPGRGRRLRDALAPGSFAHVVELVPWRGTLGDDAGARVRALAAELRGHPSVDAVSITDSAGGHAMLSPEVLASELAAVGQEAIVHVTCRDRNRNELLSLGWRLASAGIGNLLVLSGDYPTEGYLGMARPVFDLDSVSLLALYEASNRGTIGRGVVGRPVPRDRARDVVALGQAPGYAKVPTATDFFLGAAVNPFKRLERDLVPQYLKLSAKARAGARFAITQVGYDPRKLDECVRFVAERAAPAAPARQRLRPLAHDGPAVRGGRGPGRPDQRRPGGPRGARSRFARQGSGVLHRARRPPGRDRPRPRIRGGIPRRNQQGRRDRDHPRASGVVQP